MIYVKKNRLQIWYNLEFFMKFIRLLCKKEKGIILRLCKVY